MSLLWAMSLILVKGTETINCSLKEGKFLKIEWAIILKEFSFISSEFENICLYNFLNILNACWELWFGRKCVPSSLHFIWPEFIKYK